MREQIKPIVIGTAGAGYAAFLHGKGYMKVSGVPIRLKTICDVNAAAAKRVQDEYHYEAISTDFDEMVADPEIDVIDIATPPFLHIPMAIKALKAGKHVICEKPLTGYFGAPGEENVGFTSKQHMYDEVMRSMDELRKVVNSTDRKFLYAENFVYSTPVRKAAEIIQAK